MKKRLVKRFVLNKINPEESFVLFKKPVHCEISWSLHRRSYKFGIHFPNNVKKKGPNELIFSVRKTKAKRNPSYRGQRILVVHYHNKVFVSEHSETF